MSISPSPPVASGALERLAELPLLLRQRDFLTASECQSLQVWTADREELQRLGCEWQSGETGTSTHISVALHPLLADLEARIYGALNLPNALGGVFRLRIYAVGQGHPPHLDTYEVGAHQLLATALVCIEAPSAGGETVFLQAAEGAVQIAQEAGQLLAWHNVWPTGEAVRAAMHLGATVIAGQKQVLAMFVYGDPAQLTQATRGTLASRAARQEVRTVQGARRVGALRGFGRVMAIVDDGVPRETVELLEAACFARGIRPIRVDPRGFDFAPERCLRDGDLLFRPAVSLHASRVEQHIWQRKVATFYLDADGPLFANLNATETFTRAGLPVPRSFWLDKPTRLMLRSMVEACGGVPVVVKALGYSRGIGVMRADSLASLFSIVDFASVEGNKPLLTAYIPDAIHWRVVVVGDKAVASYRNVTDDDDFRTSGSDDVDDYAAPLPKGAAELAVASCQVLRHAHGGVDILEGPGGRLYLLEANFPCYYAQAQLSGGVDVAGAMVQYLLERAEALAPPSADPLPNL